MTWLVSLLLAVFGVFGASGPGGGGVIIAIEPPSADEQGPLPPVTPARERPMRTSGGDAWRSEGAASLSLIAPTVARGEMDDDERFVRIVSIACHDLRTPLAVIFGFGQTLGRTQLPDAQARYVEMIKSASDQLSELLDELTLVTRVRTGRYDPALSDVDTLELARAAAADLEERVDVRGEGATVKVVADVTARAISRLAKAATRHGGIDSVALVVRGAELEISPLQRNAAGVVVGEELRELGAVSAVEHLRALEATLDVEGDRLLIRLKT